MISCRHLTKRYGTRIAVQDLTFDVRPGAVTAFLGPNGAGKTTTLRLMLELDHGEGVTTFDGQRFTELADPIGSVGAVSRPGPGIRAGRLGITFGCWPLEVACPKKEWTTCSNWSG